MNKQDLTFQIKQYSKMLLQHFVLPLAYWIGCTVNKKVDKNLVVFADAHHKTLPFSMQEIECEVRRRGYKIDYHLHDYSHENIMRSFFHSISFMLLFSKAGYVFICDNFLPAASCKKRKETKLIQLWHSCGLLKKMGYDTEDDIPSYYKGNVYANYDLVTVSAPCCVPCLTSGMRQPNGIVNNLGVSRTDVYFNVEWNEQCKQDFYKQFPDAKGKKIALWAPTFRGKASNPELVGLHEICKLKNHLGSEWLLISKVHPHLDATLKLQEKPIISDTTIPTERILPLVDVLITDYSSILFDYLTYQKPFVLFAPDLDAYEWNRGFYIDYCSLSPYIARTESDLHFAVTEAWSNWISGKDKEMLKALRSYHIGNCDGSATQRILDFLKMRN